MKDSSRAQVYGVLMLVPAIIGGVFSYLLTLFISYHSGLFERFACVTPLLEGLLFTALLFQRDTRFKHYMRANWRMQEEFDRNYQYQPMEAGE